MELIWYLVALFGGFYFGYTRKPMGFKNSLENLPQKELEWLLKRLSEIKKEREIDKTRTQKTDKERFAVIFGWKKIYGKKITHAGLNEEDYDETLWETDALDDYITDCTFWAIDDDSNEVHEDIDAVLESIEENQGVVFEKWLK